MICFLFLEFLGTEAHTVLTKIDGQKLFSRGMASVNSTAQGVQSLEGMKFPDFSLAFRDYD